MSANGSAMTQAIVVDRAGPVERLALREVPLPLPGPGEAQVRIEAAGVAYADIVMRIGVYPGVKAPFTPGYDFVGVVEALGPGAEAYAAVGDRVVAVTVTGSYARRRNVAAALLVQAPTAVPAPQIAAATMNGLTAWQMFHRLAQPEPGEWALVHGAAGGVGQILLDLAQKHGVRAIGTASKAKHAAVEAKGAVAIDYRREDFPARTREITEHGAFAAFDHMGGAHLQRSLKALRPGGLAVLYGLYGLTQGGRLRPTAAIAAATATVNPLQLFRDAKSLATYNVQTWRDHRQGAYRRDLAALMAALAAGQVQATVGEVLPLEEAAEAQRRLERAEGVGKIVLRC